MEIILLLIVTLILAAGFLEVDDEHEEEEEIALCPGGKIAYKKPMSQPRRIALLLAAATFALFLPAAWSGFCVYDDSLYVTDQPIVQAGVTWAGVKWAFTTMAASNWHPLTWLSHMVDCGVFGLNPAGPHLVNVLFHAANVALLFTLLWRLTNKIWPSAFIAALFAWHPLHVESVAWISERKDVLSTFFALLALLNYARHVELSKVQSPKSKVYFAWSLVAFALGLMAKPMLVTLPCLLLLLDFWPLRRISNFKFQISNPESGLPQRTLFSRLHHSSFIILALEKWPFFFITFASCAITFLAQSRSGGNAVASFSLVPLHYRLKSVPLAYVEYLSKIFWPSKLAIFYPLQERIPVSAVVLAVTALVFISLAALRLYRSRPYLLTGWLWFLGMLVPVIGLVQVGSAALADRYSYLPAVGIFLAVTFAACDLAVRFRISRPALAGISIFILGACAVTMENQLRCWHDNETLFRHALAVTTDNDTARNNLGVALEQQGRLAEAAEQYRAAARLEPDRYLGHHNLANALDHLGRPAEALAEHWEAARISPDTQFLHHVLGLSLAAAGQDDEALKEFSEAARLDPHYAWPHFETAKIFLRQNRDAAALDELRAALRIDPDNIDILSFTARVLAASENPATRNGRDAFALAAKANLLTSGRRPDVLDALGMACAELGKFDEAQMAAQSALEVSAALKLTEVKPVQQRLELYKNHQPWRESFGATNAPAKN
jgi:tetratricopeptide (TPR) repeat protein